MAFREVLSGVYGVLGRESPRLFQEFNRVPGRGSPDPDRGCFRDFLACWVGSLPTQKGLKRFSGFPGRESRDPEVG